MPRLLPHGAERCLLFDACHTATGDSKACASASIAVARTGRAVSINATVRMAGSLSRRAASGAVPIRVYVKACSQPVLQLEIQPANVVRENKLRADLRGRAGLRDRLAQFYPGDTWEIMDARSGSAT